jgi:hypothetical protein
MCLVTSPYNLSIFGRRKRPPHPLSHEAHNISKGEGCGETKPAKCPHFTFFPKILLSSLFMGRGVWGQNVSTKFDGAFRLKKAIPTPLQYVSLHERNRVSNRILS